MGDDINIPVSDNALYIKAPPCDFRYSFEQGISIFSPALEALKSIGFLPLPKSIADRIESRLDDVKFCSGGIVQTHPNAISLYGARLRKEISKLKTGDPPAYLFRDYALVDAMLRAILLPEDFTLEQKISLFDTFSARVIEKNEEMFYYRTLGYDKGRFMPQVMFLNNRYTLKDWVASGRERVEGKIDILMASQKQIRDIAGYDWKPLSFLFGDDLARLAQLKAAFLKSELEVEKSTWKKEYENFLETVNEAARLGVMRCNTLAIDSILFERFNVRVSITDVGSGAKLAFAVNEKVNDVASFAEGVGEVASCIGGIATGIGKLLFGKPGR